METRRTPEFHYYPEDATVQVKLPTDPRQKELLLWWLQQAFQDACKTMPKMEEYGGRDEGSSDLKIMGDAQAELIGQHDAPDSVKQELACWFYALGKIARLVADYKQGRSGKPDTWFDLTVYSMMARRLQEVGRWP